MNQTLEGHQGRSFVGRVGLFWGVVCMTGQKQLDSIGQWLTGRNRLGMLYVVGKIKLKLLFHDPKWLSKFDALFVILLGFCNDFSISFSIFYSTIEKIADICIDCVKSCLFEYAKDVI